MRGSFWTQDGMLLKRPLLWLVICIIFGGLWCGGTFKFRQNSIRASQVAQSSRESMATQIRQIEDEEAAIRGHIDQYRQLEVSGVIGDEERLKLVEVLGHIRAQYKFYPLQFDIGQQVVIPLREGSGEPWLSLRSSQIKFTLPLLHEEDLSRLLVELRNIGRGLFVVEECSLSRPGTEKQGDPVQLKENLNASCTLSWLTLKPEEKNPGAESAPSVSGGGV